MNELLVHRAAALTEIGLGVATFVALFWITAPYGRHTRAGWGPSVSQRLGWVLMEAPASLLWLAIFAMGAHAWEPAPLAFAALWQLHYMQRTFIFPLRLRASGKVTPLAVVLMADVFNSLNAYVNARWVSHLGGYTTAWLTSPQFIFGAALFLAGFTLNLQSDSILMKLRAPGESGYKIPRGGLYRWVSCPNYLAEILEWTGWAIATWSLAGAAFAIYTFANLAPRAISNHRWYQEKFSDYPVERRALIPYLW
ncbi:MAG: DUF1295 domain-containing protein [Polyangiaceae bacterium]